MFGQSGTNKHMGRTNILWDEQTYGPNKPAMGRTNIWDEQTYGTNKHIMGRTNIGIKKVEMLNFFLFLARS